MPRLHRIEIAALAVLALLVGFESVVRQSMRQGESRRLAVSRHAAAWSECGRVAAQAGRDACRARVVPIDGRLP